MPRFTNNLTVKCNPKYKSGKSQLKLPCSKNYKIFISITTKKKKNVPL